MKLFGTAGIRGPILKKVTPELVLKFGLSLATSLGNKGVVTVGHDTRTSSIMLKHSLLSGLLAGGCNALDLGLIPMPVLSHFCNHSKVDAGVMITASHNPPEDNGLKCLTSDGMEYVPGEEAALESLILGDKYRRVPWNKIGESKEIENAAQSYSDAILKRVGQLGKRPLHVVVDCANGTAYNLVPTLLRRMGCTLATLNVEPDGHFPGRMPEPKPDNLGEIMETVPRVKAAIGFAYDTDADRVAIIDDHGGFVGQSRVIALFAREAVEAHGGTVVTSVDASLCIDEVVEKAGGRVERTRLGQIHVPLRENRDIVFCGEPWKLMDLSWGPWVDGIYSTARMIKMLSEKGATASQIFSEIPEYPWARLSTPCPDELKSLAMSKIEDALLKETGVEDVWTFDGVRLNYEDRSWLLIRPSGTQPLVKIYCEAKTRERLKDLADFGMETTRNAIKQPQRA